ncbi:hypothetical protein EIN_461760 [Entamoeba invadens IP1]|uniref:Uncharacterized protein n=1 Tax=Entamoeba invadens IP1 TaxID=370355 RepID=A0A0A1U6E5_ENTIV|nr:hypothetical protein EIN_461760 [Entamoeba invadens IP1]ELP89870.1 hypothetical protein EIN_461760 [Entamoeba invadens IP1]|eukprot:XP_004256641.1 hypothetical protein EIN_461760 [Entamoeba invadens IP1]
MREIEILSDLITRKTTHLSPSDDDKFTVLMNEHKVQVISTDKGFLYESTYDDMAQNSILSQYRYVAFEYCVKSPYTTSSDEEKPLKLFESNKVDTSEFSLFPKQKCIKRLTITVDSASDPPKTIPSYYDILCFKPITEDALNFVLSKCTCEVITFDFHLNKFRVTVRNIRNARRLGVFFEINVYPLLSQPPLDESNRRQFIAQATDLVFYSKGRNLILSTGATIPSEMKGPEDLIAIGMSFGLTRSQAHDSIFKNPMTSLTRARKRVPFKSMVSF